MKKIKQVYTAQIIALEYYFPELPLGLEFWRNWKLNATFTNQELPQF